MTGTTVTVAVQFTADQNQHVTVCTSGNRNQLLWRLNGVTL